MARSVVWHLVVAALTIGVAAAASGSRGVYAQAGKRVSVYDARPLAEAYLELVKESRSLVSYEDAYYEYKGDLFDYRSESHPLQANRNSPQMWFAPRRSLVFDYSASDLSKPDVLFANLVSNYNVNYFENEYRLVREGQWLHILPKAAKNPKGEIIDRASRLNVRVTFPDAERTVETTIKLLTDTINKTESTSILLGVGAERLLDKTKVRTGAQNEIARHVLMRLLEATGRKVTWSLLCSYDATPGKRTELNDGACGLNFIDLG